VTFGGVAVETMPIDEPVEPPAPLPTGRVYTGANAMVTVWDHDVIDSGKVPRSFLSVDESKIKAHVKYKKDMGEEPYIMGIRFTKRVDVRSR